MALGGRQLGEAAIATITGRSHAAADSGRVYVDQTHPLLWFVERLAEFLPESLFVFPWRPNEQVLASMLRHAGVLEWYERIRAGTIDAAFPSRFFGIPSAAAVRSLPLDELCLARITSHKRECLRLRGLLGPDRVRVAHYEQLVLQGADAVATLLSPSERIALGPCVGTCQADVESLEKYERNLTAAQIGLARSREVPLP